MAQAPQHAVNPSYSSASPSQQYTTPMSSHAHFSLPPLTDHSILSMADDYDDDDLADLPNSSFDAVPGPSGSSSSSSRAFDKVIRRRSSKACDQCRKSKCKCERSSDREPCKSCIMLGTPCTFLGPSRKRGPPKGYIDAIEARLHQTEALIGIMLAAEDPRAKGILDDLAEDPLAREIIHRVDNSPYGVKGRDSKASGKARADSKSKTPPESGETLTSSHPSNEWQDRLSRRLTTLARSRGTSQPPETSSSPRRPDSDRPSLSLSVQSDSRPISACGRDGDERERRQRRRMSPPSPAGSHRSRSTRSSDPGDMLDEHDREADDDALVSEVGQLSLNEEREVRFHGKASGLHLLGVKDRVDGRSEGGIWRFPKARVWPPLPSDHPTLEKQMEAELVSIHLPEQSVQEHLLDLYFTYVHPALPIVHKESFLEDFRNGHIAAHASPPASDSVAESPGGSTASRRSSPIAPVLLLAMFAVAARYTQHDDSTVPPSESAMWPAGDVYLEQAKRLLIAPDASSRPVTCQALLLMGYREIGIGAMAQSWLYVGVAVRMAQDLGIHKSADRWMRGGNAMFTRVELQERRRIWYACVVMDKYVSTYIGRPLAIYEQDFDTELPSLDEPDEMDDWRPMEEEDKHPSVVAVPGRILSCFNASANLSIILSKIVQAIYAVRSGPGRHAESLRLEELLDKWYLDVPVHLRYDPVGGAKADVPLPHVLTLHMQYWCVVLLLHRPFMRYVLEVRAAGINGREDPELHAISQKNYDLCVQAANYITSIVATYTEHYSINHVPVFLCYYVFTASIMHVTTLTAYPEDPHARLGLTTCMDILKSMSIVWPSAGRAWELLHGSKVNLSSATRAELSPTSSEERTHKRSADHFMQEDEAHFFAAPRASQYVSPQSPPPTQPFYTSYDRWPGEGGLAAYAGSLSTSVLPQQYSTGFVDRGAAAAVGPESEAHGAQAQQPAFWSDYGTLNQLSTSFGGPLGQDPPLSQQQQQPPPSHQSQMYQLQEHYQMFGGAMHPPHS
ncbi:hypothetical protein BV25DRAFT_1831290 [Artomyces pyxidatus]|uniref:Uncharacterized protein n=1 Tax=Artomyces pyxidatus TaxID=48021 RepID=A0ACB8SLJ9_9AGAM|nr:hypothetical protein BV25DRAFT_1831290 [Artomyces pyxidatus]